MAEDAPPRGVAVDVETLEWRSLGTRPLPVYGKPGCGCLERTAGVDDFIADLTSHEPGAELPPHWHERLVLGVILEGRAIEWLEGRKVTLEPGTAFIRPSGVVHSYRFVKPTKVFSIELGNAWLERTRALDVVNGFGSRELPGCDAATVLRAYRAFSAIDPASRCTLILEGYTLALLGELARGVTAPRLWLQQARQILVENFRNPFRLAEIAAAVRIHPVHLSREFARQFGVTMTEFVRQRRLDYAVTLLCSTDEPVSTIAARAGFADQAHFTRTFRREMGTTPGAYRAAVRLKSGPTAA